MKTATYLCLAAILAVALTGASAGADTIYRWVDDNGVINYTQQKPRGRDAVAINTGSEQRSRQTAEPAPPPPTSAATGEPLNPEQERMLKGLRAAEQHRQEEIARIKAENCQRSRDVLTRLTLKNRIRVRGEDGEYRIMPEDERQKRISEAQQNIARYCASS